MLYLFVAQVFSYLARICGCIQVRRLDTDQIRVEAAIARLSLNADIVACTDGITVRGESTFHPSI